MTPFSAVVEVDISGIRVGCDLCGAIATFLGSEEEIARPAASWALPHLFPRVRAVRASVNGRELGWTEDLGR